MAAQAETHSPRILLAYDVRRGLSPAVFAAVLAAGGCESVIFYDSGSAAEEALFQKTAAPLVAAAQAQGAAALICGASSLCGRLGADGLHIEHQAEAIAQLSAARAKHGEKLLLGFGNPQTRHEALEAGEQARPDYVFFGRLGKDSKAEAHARNLALGAWWAEVTQIDCVLQAGASLESLPACAAAKPDFIALEQAVFGAAEPEQAMRQAQAILRAERAG